MPNKSERYFRLGNGNIVMVLYDDPDLSIAVSSDGDDAADTAFPFFPEDFNAQDLGTLEDIIARPELRQLFNSLAPTDPLLLKPLSLVRMLIQHSSFTLH